jgi:hypothetical protein
VGLRSYCTSKVFHAQVVFFFRSFFRDDLCNFSAPVSFVLDYGPEVFEIELTSVTRIRKVDTFLPINIRLRGYESDFITPICAQINF